MEKKVILLIMDGLGDTKKPNTPLESAKTPNMNELAREGITGTMLTLGGRVVPTSDKAHLVLFGYNLKEYYPGRGPLEALGAGMKLKKGDVAFRTNFGTIKNGKVIDRRAGRIETKYSIKLGKILSMKIEDVKLIFRGTVEHRGALILRGEGLSDKVCGTDPHKLGKPKKCCSLDGKKDSKKTARIINKFMELSIEKLSQNQLNIRREKVGKVPANIVLLRGAGKFRKIPTMKKRFNIKSTAIAGGALYKGVAKYVGMNVLDVKGATGDRNTNLKAKGRSVLSSLKNSDFVFVHVKATDSFSHDGDCVGKKNMIERVDKELLPYLFKAIRNKKNKIGLIITGDHSTPCELKKHSADPVPILMWGFGKDNIKKFGEKYCKKGKLGKIYGKEIISCILNFSTNR